MISSSNIELAIKYLRVLDLRPVATAKDIKNAYRTLSKVWHPDRFQADPKLQTVAQEKLKEINVAYDWLIHHPDVVSFIRDNQPNDPKNGPTDRKPTHFDKSEKQPPKPPPASTRDGISPKRISPAYVVIIIIIAVIWVSRLNNQKKTLSPASYSTSPPSANSNPQIILGAPVSQAVPTSPPTNVETKSQESTSKRSPDLSMLSPQERQSIESSCSEPKYLRGPAAYNECLFSQLAKLNTGRRRPDLSSLDLYERQSIEAACSEAKYLRGPAAYNDCLASHLNQVLSGPRRPDISTLNLAERQSIEAACSEAKYLRGPAAYNDCLIKQLDKLSRGPRSPDLSMLSRQERQSIEAACSEAKYLRGPSDYNNCLIRHLRSLGLQD